MSRIIRWAVILVLAAPAAVLRGEDGDMAFARCSPCHQENGAGYAGTYPPLVTHAPEVATHRSYLIAVLLYGLDGPIEIQGHEAKYQGLMPNQYEMADGEAAAVLNFVLTRWGNEKLLPKDFKPITPAEVRAERNKHLTPRQMYEARQHLDLLSVPSPSWIRRGPTP